MIMHDRDSRAPRGCDEKPIVVIPAPAGIQFVGLISFENDQMNDLDSRVRENVGRFGDRF